MKNKAFDFRGFSKLDNSEHADFLIKSMKELAKDRIINKIKDEAFECLFGLAYLSLKRA